MASSSPEAKPELTRDEILEALEEVELGCKDEELFCRPVR
jgi:hypothetical protein